MALSQLARNYLTVALANKARAKEIADAIDALHAVAPAAHVANLAAYAPVTGVDGTGSNAASKADVDTELSAVYSKINAILAALEAAGLMS